MATNSSMLDPYLPQELQVCLVRLQEIYGPLAPSSLRPSRIKGWTPSEDPGTYGHRGRHLWTDALGVLCLLTLSKQRGAIPPASDCLFDREPGEGVEDDHRERWDLYEARWAERRAEKHFAESVRYLAFANNLAITVHNILGRTRAGYQYLPPASALNLMLGGLRSGTDREKGPNGVLGLGRDAITGPDGDHQAHRALTMWMFALNRLSIAANEWRNNADAIELARAIHVPFHVHQEQMVEKISSDMTQVLSDKEGFLDPLVGLVVCRLLQARTGYMRPLQKEIADYRRHVNKRFWFNLQVPDKDVHEIGWSLWTSHWLKGVPGESWAGQLQQKIVERLEKDLETIIQRGVKYNRTPYHDFTLIMGIRCACPDNEKLMQLAQNLSDWWGLRLDVQVPRWQRPITWVMYACATCPGVLKKGFLGPESSWMPLKDPMVFDLAEYQEQQAVIAALKATEAAESEQSGDASTST